MTPEARKYFSLFLQFRVSKNEGCKGTCRISEADLASPHGNCRIKKNNREQTEVRHPQHHWCQSKEGIRRSVPGRGRQTQVLDGAGGWGPTHPAGAVPVRELGLCGDAVPQAPWAAGARALSRSSHFSHVSAPLPAFQPELTAHCPVSGHHGTKTCLTS